MLTVPFRTEHNRTERIGRVYTLHHGTVLERPEQLFLSSGNGPEYKKKFPFSVALYCIP